MRLRFFLVGLFFAVTTVGVCANSYLALTSPMFFTPDDYGFGVRQQVGRLVLVRSSPPALHPFCRRATKLFPLTGKIYGTKQTSSPPFHREQIYTELLSSILHGSFHVERGSKEAERLDAVLQKCLAKDREARFSSVGEMQRELVPAIREYRLLGRQEWSGSEADTLLS